MYFLENNHPPVPRLVWRDEKGSNGDGACNIVEAQCKVALFTQCNVLLNITALAHGKELFIAAMLGFKGQSLEDKGVCGVPRLPPSAFSGRKYKLSQAGRVNITYNLPSPDLRQSTVISPFPNSL
jgi:hypothetical protein